MSILKKAIVTAGVGAVLGGLALVYVSPAGAQASDRPGRPEGCQAQGGVNGPGPGFRGGPNRQPPPFEELDVNSDGKLSPDEAKDIPPVRFEGFETLDADGDGYLTSAELPPPPGRGMGQGMGRGPGQGQGRGMGPQDGMRRGPGQGRGMGQGLGPQAGLQRGPGQGRGLGPQDGMRRGPGQGRGMGRGLGPQAGSQRGPGQGFGRLSFEDMDQDKDGVLSAEEFNSAHADRPGPPEFAPRDGRGRQDGPPRGPEGRRGGPPRFEDHDADSDGKLSPEEAAGIPPVDRWGFEALDEDGDGYLTREELPPPPPRGPGQQGPGPR